jgi:hypothetical protein
MYKKKYIKYKTKYIALKNKLDNASNTMQDGGSPKMVLAPDTARDTAHDTDPDDDTVIIMDPIVLYKNKNNSDEYCSKIKTLMSENKTFVRVPEEGLDNFNENSTPKTELIADAARYNPSGVKCTFASLLIPGWYETYEPNVAGLFCNYKDGKFIDVNELDQECNLKNYIWPTDAGGQILNRNLTINLYDAMFGMKNQAISFKDFMIYIYENNLLTDKEKHDFQIFYDNKDSLDWGQILLDFSNKDSLDWGQKLLDFLNKDNLRLKLERLIRNCFKTYSAVVLFVKNVKRTPNMYCGKEGWKTKDYQEEFMWFKYTETLLPEHNKLGGLYVPSIYKCKQNVKKYNELKELAIKKAIELNIPVFSLEERR